MRPRRWTFWSLPFWSLPARVWFPVVVVDLAAAASVALTAAQQAGGLAATAWLVPALTLALAGVVSTEASLGVERRRRRTGDGPHINLSSVWAFAAALLLPGPLAAATVLVVYGHLYLRVWRPSGVPAHRVLFSTATIVLAVQAAAAVAGLAGGPALFRSSPGVLALVAAGAVYALLNVALVVAMIVLSTPPADAVMRRRLLGPADGLALEVATLALGGLVAAAIAQFGPVYALLGLPPLVVLHRSVLVRQLEEAASTDGKTGLLNAAAWRVQAGRELRRAERAGRPATVLLLDLDHFKGVNDRHGHLVGDQVLAAVAGALRAEVREEDLVGRFGGEEFVVLLHGEPDSDPRTTGEGVAERIRARIAELAVPVTSGLVVDGLSASIGGATASPEGPELGVLLEIADAALYAAKRAGRDRVHMGRTCDAGRRG